MNASATMGKLPIRHLVTKPSGYYFQATPAMRRAGMESEALGTDPVAAAARAQHLNAYWDALRTEHRSAAAPEKPGTFAWLVADLKTRGEYKSKSPRTKSDIEAALAEIDPIFGAAPLAIITPDRVETFYGGLVARRGVTVAALVMKWFRYIFNFGLRLHPRTLDQLGVEGNPTYAVRIRHPRPRQTVWPTGTVWRAVRQAWRGGWPGVAVAIAIAYDTGLRPQDVRAITPAQLDGNRLTLVPQKTEHLDDRETVYTLWGSTARLIARYRRTTGIALMPQLPLIRSASARPFGNRHHLAKQIRQVLRAVGLPDELQLRDLRRTGNKEAAEGGATEAQLAARNRHSIEQSSRILDTYTPKTVALAEAAQAVRKRGKRGLTN